MGNGSSSVELPCLQEVCRHANSGGKSSTTVLTVGVRGCLSLILLYFCVLLSYRTYRRPRYKVAYKMVTEMEWKCCHGYSGEDCHDGPKVTTDTQVNGGRPRVTQTGHNTGGGQRGDSRDGERTATLACTSWDIASLTKLTS